MRMRCCSVRGDGGGGACARQLGLAAPHSPIRHLRPLHLAAGVRPHTPICVSSYSFVFSHTGIDVSSYTHICVSSYAYICVLILKHTTIYSNTLLYAFTLPTGLRNSVLILLHMCPQYSYIYVSSYLYTPSPSGLRNCARSEPHNRCRMQTYVDVC